MESPMELAIVLAFIAIGEIEMSGAFFVEGAEGEHGAGYRVFAGESFGLVVHFMSDPDGFEGPDSLLTPLVSGQFFHFDHFHGGFGLVRGDEGVDESGKTDGRFAWNEDHTRQEAVAQVVARGASLAGGSFGAGGFQGVGPVGREFLF